MELKIVPSKKNIATDKAPFFSDNKMLYGDKAPESGDHKIGDFIISNTQANDIFGWVCVEAGNPGVWNVIGEGSGKISPYYNIVQFSDSRNHIEIGIEEYNAETDLLEVHYDGLLLVQNIHYRINADGISIDAIGDPWNKNADDNHEMAFRALKNNVEIDLEPQKTVVVQYKNNIVVNEEVSEVNIGIFGFDKTKDILTVYKNSTYLIEGIDYEISADGKKIACKEGSWKADNGSNCFSFESLKNATILDPGTLVSMENLDSDLREAIENAGGTFDSSNFATKQELNSYATKQELNSYATKQDLNNYATKQDLNNIDITSTVGVLDSLTTTDKTNLVNAINELHALFNSQREATINEINSLIDKI